MAIIPQLESILFVASKPIGIKKMSKVLNVSKSDLASALQELALKYNSEDSGLRLIENGDEWQLVSSPDNKTLAENFVKAELAGELTRPQLETLTVISYCGPITKPELEQIRGVNCSLILRNLMLRGLVDETEDAANLLPSFRVTVEYLRHLGINSVSELPQYAELHEHQYVVQTLAQAEQ